MNTDSLTAGVKGSAQSWVGVIRDGNKVIWECPHLHCNRSHTTYSNRAARDCSGRVLQFLKKPEMINEVFRWYHGAQAARKSDYDFDQWCAEQSKQLSTKLNAA